MFERLDTLPCSARIKKPTGRSVLIMVQQRSEDTRAQIIEAAVQLFCRSGYDATGVAEICSLAAVSKGAFYHHFPSKKDLFLAIVNDWLQGVDTQLYSFSEPGKTVPQAMTDMAQVLGTIFSVASGRLPMFMEFMVQASRDKAIWDAATAPYQEYQAMFANMLDEGIREGSIKPQTDSQTAAWVFMAFSLGILLQGVVIPDAADWENIAQEGMRMLLESMQRSKK